MCTFDWIEKGMIYFMKVVIATNNEVKVEGAKRELSHYFKDVVI